MFKVDDLKYIQEKGIGLERIVLQMDNFTNGFPSLDIRRAARLGDGILSMSQDEVGKYLKVYDSLCGCRSIVKFVPASGAATRMFKDMFVFVEKFPASKVCYEDFIVENKLQSVDVVMQNLDKFAFYGALKEKFAQRGESVEDKIKDKRFLELARMILFPEGLNYGALPKGLLEFHIYKDGVRTPVEEQMMEGVLYACGRGTTVNIHFTVSPEHEAMFREVVEKTKPTLAERYGVNIETSFSTQKHYTDTIAVNPDNSPFRDDNNQIVFRPAGHGALIENLNELPEDIVFVKNIDNVVTDACKEKTVLYKKVLAGKLLALQNRAFGYLKGIDLGRGLELLDEMEDFVSNRLMVRLPEQYDSFSPELKMRYLQSKLNRPIRVCGMVRNEGEPGGGPFWVTNQDGSISLQIVESAQIDMEDPEKVLIFKNSSHFNPVDLVCGIRDYKGEKFNLLERVDKKTGFISSKSSGGRSLKALELPGLWNGSMSDWNTVFVEVPVETFNPVKTVNDLLKRQPDYSCCC